MLASLFSFRSFFPLQHVLQERSLVRRESLAASEREKESVAVFYKHWRQPLSSLSDWDSSRMSGVGPARTVVEHHGRKRTRPVWFPEKGFEVQIPAAELDCLRRDRCPQ